MSDAAEIHRVGDRALLIDLDDNASVHRAAVSIRAGGHPGLEDVVPGHTTLLLVWDVEVPSLGAVSSMLETARTHEPPAHRERHLTLPVRYDGPDLEAVASTLAMSPDDLVARHLACEYRVAFIGFAPGFAYLIGGDPALSIARRVAPRTRVPAGSLAIAGPYCAIYPRAAPGGWNLIGSCDVVLFDPARERPALLEPGAHVRFERT